MKFINDIIPIDYPDREQRLQEMFVTLHRFRDITPSYDNVYLFKRNPFDRDEVSMAVLSKEEAWSYIEIDLGVSILPDHFTRPLIDYMIVHPQGVTNDHDQDHHPA